MAKIKKEKISLEEKFKELNKKYEKTVIFGNQLDNYDTVISTGSLDLDIKTGIGGIPLSFKEIDEETGLKKSRNGKIVEIYGWESTAKSTLVQTIAGNAQKDGRNVLLINSENSLSDNYSQELGLDLSKLYVIQIDETGGEQAYSKAQQLIDTGEVDLVIIDSYNLIRPLKEYEKNFEGGQMGNFAKLMGEICNIAVKNCTAYGTTTIFVGQLREKIGIMMGNPETTQGGHALKFVSHMRLKTSRSITLENSILGENKDKIGNLHKVFIEKNKLAAPFRKAEFIVNYGEGINKYQEIIDLAPLYLENTKVYGKTFTFKNTKYLIEDFKSMLIDNEEFFQEIRKEILEAGLKKKNGINIPKEIIEKEVIEQISDEI